MSNRHTRILYKLWFLVGLFMLAVGLFMKFYNVESHGWMFSKFGNSTEGMLDGNGTLIIAILILASSIFLKISHNIEKRDYEKRKNIEEQEDALRKKRIINKN